MKVMHDGPHRGTAVARDASRVAGPLNFFHPVSAMACLSEMS